MDLSKLSTEDLMALKGGDLSKVSTAGLRSLKTAQTRETIDNDAISTGARNFNADASFGSNVLTGIGRGMASVGRALSFQGKEATEEAARLDKPLLNTAGGAVGNVVGTAALAAPAAFVPGVNTALGAAATGTVLGGFTTEGGLSDRLTGAALGGAGGAAGVGLGKGLGVVADRIKGSRAAAQTANAGKDAAAVQARQAGYVLPPTEVNPSMLNSALEGLSGKIKTSQAASTKNQPVTNRLVREDLGLPADSVISADALKAIRTQAGQAYEAVATSGTITPSQAYGDALDKIVAPYVTASKGFPNAKANPIIAEIDSLRSPSFDAGSAVGKIRELRESADGAFAAGRKQESKALKDAAKALEDAIDSHVSAAGPSKLLDDFRSARTTIAKTYNVEKALTGTNGDVSAKILADQLKRGKPLTGNLRTVAETGQNFSKATQALPQNYNALSPLDFLAGGIGYTQNPLLAAGVIARPAVRSGILSQPFQNTLKPPSYGQNALLELLRDNRYLPVAGMAPAGQQ